MKLISQKQVLSKNYIALSKVERVLKDIWLSRTSYLMMAPYLFLFTVFVALPVFSSIFLSFTYYNILEFPKFIGWSNYKLLMLEDDVFLKAIQNTMKFALITGPVSYFACLLFAWFVNELRPKIRAIATLLFYIPSLSGNMLVIWTYIFANDTHGAANALLMSNGIISQPIAWLADPDKNLYVIMLVQLWMSLGTGFLAFIAGLQGIDKNLFEAGAIDGIKNRWQELYHITIPSIKPQLLFGAVMQITATFAVGDICASLAGFPSPKDSALTVVLHMQDYGSIRYEMGYASAIAVLLFSFTLGINQLIRTWLVKD